MAFSATALMASKSRSHVLQAGIAAAAICYALLQFTLFVRGYPGEPLQFSDSDTYRAWSTAVPVGYPAFLWAVPLTAVPIVQFGIFQVSALAVFFSVWRFSLVAACVAFLGLVSFAPTWLYAMSVLTESLTLSAILLHLAAMTWYAYRPSRIALVVAGATVGVAALLRPASYFLGVLVFLTPLLVMKRGARLRPFAMIIATAAIVFAAGAIPSYFARGVATQTLGGEAMYGHVAHLYDPARSTLPEAIKQKATELRDAILERRRAAHSVVELQAVETEMFNPTVHAMTGAFPDEDVSEMFGTLSRESILADPAGYVETVMANVVAGYSEYTFSMPQIPRPDTPSGRLLGQLQPIPVPELVPKKWLLNSFAISIPVLLLLIRMPLARVGLYAAALNGLGVLFTSVATVFIPRYGFVLDPAAMVAIACAAGAAIMGGYSQAEIWLLNWSPTGASARE